MEKFIYIIKELGVPTLLGGILGFSFSIFQTWRSNKREDKKWRREISQDIFSEIYAWNIIAHNELINEFGQTTEEKTSGRLRYIEAAEKLNKIEASAKLFVSNEVAETIEEIKKSIPKMANEFLAKEKDGNMPKLRKDLDSAKEYQELINKLKLQLSNFIG